MVELEALAGLARGAAPGHPSAAVIIAGPGLGKTRLLDEASRSFGFPWVGVHGFEPASEIALGAAGGLLHELVRAPVSGQRLDALLSGEVGVGLETLRLFETSFRCLVELAPLAIVVDDLQWVDSQTLALFRYAFSAARTAGAPLLLLGAGRPAAGVESFAVGMRELLEPDRFLEVELGPLEAEAGIELACGLRPELDRAAAEALWRRAQGSPFWLFALAREQQVGAAPARAIRGRYSSLGGDAAELFALFVVAAQPLPAVAAAEMLDWEQERASHALGVLVNRGLVVQEGGAARIAHDLIREAAWGEIPDAERRRFHRRLADWFEATASADVRQLARALEHRRASGLATDELALRILRSPRRRLLGVEGLTALGEIADDAGDRTGIALQREVAALASELGEWTSALERWEALVERLPDTAERGVAAVNAAAAAFRLGRADDVHAFLNRAREFAQPGDSLFEIDADFHEAQSLLWLENRVGDAEPVVARALATAERLVGHAGGVDKLEPPERRAYVRALRAKLDTAIREANAGTVARWADLIQAGASDPGEALAAASDGVFATLQLEGRPKSAEPRARRALEESRRLALPSLEVEATHWVGLIAHQRARLDEAAELLQQAVTLAERVGPPRRFHISQLRAMQHSVEASRADWRRGLAGIADSIAAEPDPHYRMVIWTLRVWLAGRFESAGESQLARLLAPMAVDAEIAGCGRCLWESVLHGAEAQARLGHVEGAEAALERWDAANPNPPAGPRARRAYAGALLESHRGPAESPPLFARARKLAAQAGHDLMCLWIDLDAAIVLAAVDRTAAIASLRTVAQSAEGIGARSEQQLAVRELRRLGVRTWRRRGAGGLLTAREVEIARLVAAGESNPDIASALFLSRKTVERHVSNILSKVGARNRTELAAHLDAMPGALDAGAPR